MTDTDRLNWIVNQTQYSTTLLLYALRLPPDTLAGTGTETPGDLFRQAIDRKLAETFEPAKPILGSAYAGRLAGRGWGPTPCPNCINGTCPECSSP
jgi:hypothetical protein